VTWVTDRPAPRRIPRAHAAIAGHQAAVLAGDVTRWAPTPTTTALDGPVPAGAPFEAEPIYVEVCAKLGYPAWPAGEPFPHQLVVGEVLPETQALPLADMFDDEPGPAEAAAFLCAEIDDAMSEVTS